MLDQRVRPYRYSSESVHCTSVRVLLRGGSMPGAAGIRIVTRVPQLSSTGRQESSASDKLPRVVLPGPKTTQAPPPQSPAAQKKVWPVDRGRRSRCRRRRRRLQAPKSTCGQPLSGLPTWHLFGAAEASPEEPQGRGGVFAAKAVEIQGRGRCLRREGTQTAYRAEAAHRRPGRRLAAGRAAWPCRGRHATRPAARRACARRPGPKSRRSAQHSV